MLGKAIKALELPREELVIMTKVGSYQIPPPLRIRTPTRGQVYFAVAKPPNTSTPANPEDAGIINQHGLNRKVRRMCSLVECRS